MYDNVIWVDSSYWFWSWFGLTVVLCIIFMWIDRGNKYGPADMLAKCFGQGVGAGVGSAVIMFCTLTILKWFGVDLGMKS